jgi:hypothetical protein
MSAQTQFKKNSDFENRQVKNLVDSYLPTNDITSVPHVCTQS